MRDYFDAFAESEMLKLFIYFECDEFMMVKMMEMFVEEKFECGVREL